MKRKRLIASILAILCGWTFCARGDCNVQQIGQISGVIAGVSPTNVQSVLTNVGCSLDADTDFQCIFNNSAFSGAYTYSEVHHEVIREPPGGVVVTNVLIYDVCRVAGTAVEGESLWQPGDDYEDDVMANSVATATEDLWIEWNSTNAPPTSITFQGVYLVQGQIGTDYADGSAYCNVNVDEGASIVEFPKAGLYTSAVSAAFSTNVLGQTVTRAVNALSSLGVSLQVSVQWGDPVFIFTNLNTGDGYAASYTSPAWFAASCYLEGYTNIVDESNRPVDPGKLIFRYVNPKDPTNVGYLVPPRPIAPTPPSLQFAIQPVGPAFPSSGLILQWPLYASDYQLQMTTNLPSGVWTTDSLPASVQAGPFLQVTVRATNSSAFFRLVQK